MESRTSILNDLIQTLKSGTTGEGNSGGQKKTDLPHHRQLREYNAGKNAWGSEETEHTSTNPVLKSMNQDTPTEPAPLSPKLLRGIELLDFLEKNPDHYSETETKYLKTNGSWEYTVIHGWLDIYKIYETTHCVNVPMAVYLAICFKQTEMYDYLTKNIRISDPLWVYRILQAGTNTYEESCCAFMDKLVIVIDGLICNILAIWIRRGWTMAIAKIRSLIPITEFTKAITPALLQTCAQSGDVSLMILFSSNGDKLRTLNCDAHMNLINSAIQNKNVEMYKYLISYPPSALTPVFIESISSSGVF
jgi:hypothetical protein